MTEQPTSPEEMSQLMRDIVRLWMKIVFVWRHSAHGRSRYRTHKAEFAVSHYYHNLSSAIHVPPPSGLSFSLVVKTVNDPASNSGISSSEGRSKASSHFLTSSSVIGGDSRFRRRILSNRTSTGASMK